MALCGCSKDGKYCSCEPRGVLVIEKCHMCVHKLFDATCGIFRNPYSEWKREGICRDFITLTD